MNKPRSPTRIFLETKSSGDKTIDRMVQDYVQNVVATFGGWDELTAGEYAMLLSQKLLLQTVLRCQNELAKQEGGLLDGKGKPSNLQWLMVRFQSEFRAGQVALGLARPRITSRKPQNLVGQSRDTIAAITEEYAEKTKAEKRQLKVV